MEERQQANAERFSLRRVVVGSLIAIPASSVLAGVLLLLPAFAALGCLFTGLTLFMVGEGLGCRWCVAAGGVAMFAGVFAAAIHGVLG